MIGYILALISSVFFSLYIIPRKLSKLSPIIFSFYMSVGFSLSSIALYLFQPVIKFHETPSLFLLWSVLAGVIWAASFVCFVISIDKIGLSRSNQWKNLQGPVAVILGLLILGEFATTNPIFALLAAISIFLSALFFTYTSSKDKKNINRNGIYLATLSSVGFGTVAIIQKFVTQSVGIYSQQVVWSLSILASLFLYIVIKGKVQTIFANARREKYLGLGAGIVYLGASIFQLFSYKFIPASIAFTVIQLNTFWTITIGILVFKEIDVKKNGRQIFFGFLFTLIGVLLLTLARK